MNRYMIYCCPGTGGLFLSTVIAQTLGYEVAAKFSSSGHAHNMGRGNWRGADSVCFVGNHWDICYKPGEMLYYAHVMPDNFLKNNPDITLVKIISEPKDYRKLTEILVKKAWPDIWTQEEYNKWAGPDYPPYSPDNIPNSEIIVNDLINDFETSIIAEWHDKNKNVKSDHTINFMTIMGVGDQDIVKTVENILQLPVSEYTKKYIAEYQTLNQGLYFNV